MLLVQIALFSAAGGFLYGLVIPTLLSRWLMGSDTNITSEFFLYLQL